MFCKSCGKLLKETDKFCSKCGASAEVNVDETLVNDKVEETSAYAEVTETPANDAVEEAPSYDEVTETPANDAVEEAPSYAEVTETPANDAVKEAPSYDEVTETPVNATEDQASGEDSLPNTGVTEKLDATPNETSAQMYYGTENYGYHIPPEPQKKKRSAGKIIAVVAAAAVIVVGGVGVVNASAINNLVKQSFSSPESYFQYVEEKQVKETSSAVADLYGSYLERYETLDTKSTSGEMKIELGANARAMLQALTATDMSFLENATITYECGYQENAMGLNLGMLIGDKQVISLESLLDMEGGMAYFLIPELSNQYLSTPLDMSEVDVSANMNQMSEAVKMMPSADVVEDLYLDYYTTAISCIDTVEKRSETIEAGGISQKCTVLTATIDNETAKEMVEVVCTKLKTDKKIETVIKDFANVENAMVEGSADGETMYQEFVQAMDESLASVDSLAMDENITMTIWVNAKGEIVGRDVRVSDAEVKYMAPSKGSKVGFRASITADGENYAIEGSGKVSMNKLSGEYAISSNGTDYVSLEVKDYDVKKMKDGYFNGTFTLSMTSEGSRALTETAMTANYDLQFDCKSSKDSSEIKISVLSLDQLMGALTITSNLKDKVDVTLPSAEVVVSAEDETALMNWISSVDWAGFTASLREAGLPSELVDSIESATSSLSVYSNY